MSSPIDPEAVIEGPVEGQGEVVPEEIVPVEAKPEKPAKPEKKTKAQALADVAADDAHRNKDPEAIKRIARALVE